MTWSRVSVPGSLQGRQGECSPVPWTPQEPSSLWGGSSEQPGVPHVPRDPHTCLWLFAISKGFARAPTPLPPSCRIALHTPCTTRPHGDSTSPTHMAQARGSSAAQALAERCCFSQRLIFLFFFFFPPQLRAGVTASEWKGGRRGTMPARQAGRGREQRDAPADTAVPRGQSGCSNGGPGQADPPRPVGSRLQVGTAGPPRLRNRSWAATFSRGAGF